MSFTDIQDNIVTLLQTISTVGNVALYPQRAITPEAFEDIFQTKLATENSPVNCWLVNLESIRSDRTQAPTQTYFLTYSFKIRGYLSFNSDDSEENIRTIAEDIVELLATRITLGSRDANGNIVGANVDVEDSSVNVNSFGQEMVGPVLCSYVDISVTAVQRRMSVAFQ